MPFNPYGLVLLGRGTGLCASAAAVAAIILIAAAFDFYSNEVAEEFQPLSESALAWPSRAPCPCPRASFESSTTRQELCASRDRGRDGFFLSYTVI